MNFTKQLEFKNVLTNHAVYEFQHATGIFSKHRRVSFKQIRVPKRPSRWTEIEFLSLTKHGSNSQLEVHYIEHDTQTSILI